MTEVETGMEASYEEDVETEKAENLGGIPALLRTFCAQQLRVALMWSGVPSPHVSEDAEDNIGTEGNLSAQRRRESEAMPPLDDEVMEHSWQPVRMLPLFSPVTSLVDNLLNS